MSGATDLLSTGLPREADPSAAAGSHWRDWIVLLKPRVMTLVVLTGAIGLYAAPVHVQPFVAAVAILCIALATGGAGAINMWYDRDIDAVMRRTAARPVPAGRVAAGDALGYGVALSVISVALMWLATNWVAAASLAFSIFFYVVIYTMWLKRSTPQNIVIGGAAGAFPPIVGWAAATGRIELLPVLLFATVFFWTPPHFWALSLYACKDYGRAGVPMLPVVRGARHTRWQILVYTLVLTAVSLAPAVLHLLGPLYLLAAAVLDAGFILLAWRVLRDDQAADGTSLTGDKPARRAFRFSLLYLAVLFAAVPLDQALFPGG
ncbi:heme o synthase [Rhizosaccharibacter radicis]|uniref:Protoheme IX farnesyltransferase n=1 Tax=Rhizosaccharibacter radicis TaxID=2782605 RepID=A0ABT1VX45_9PROT|nr:heme o synthase [Acetobacteraceae bacterium KSS12]